MQFPAIISTVFAQNLVVKIDNPLCSGSTTCTLISILEQISLYLLWIGAPITTIMIIYGAFQMLTAGGDPAKFKSGSHTVLYAAIGYGIILISWGLVSLTKELLGVTTG